MLYPTPKESEALAVSEAQGKRVETVTITTQSSFTPRKPTSSEALWGLFGDVLLALPAIAFLVYAGYVIRHDGRAMGEEPISTLRSAAGYGPSIFPIAFAAVAANFLKAVAAWRLERGISLLDLDYLLGSRTVFSAFTTPFSLRSVNFLAPLLMMLWALSPIGGQAALRVMDVVASEARQPLDFQYLEVMTWFPHGGPLSSGAADILPAVNGAFSAALSSPEAVKIAPQDVFGNVKIPIVEVYTRSSKVQPGQDGWFTVDTTITEDQDPRLEYSAVSGLPIEARHGFDRKGNDSFTIETSYIYTDCTVEKSADMNQTEFTQHISRPIVYSNGKSLMLEKANTHTMWATTPLQLIFTSFTSTAVTNATCELTTTYVEAEIACYVDNCAAVRVRQLEKPANMTVLTVFDGLSPAGKPEFSPMAGDSFLRSFVNASNTAWDYTWGADSYSTPIEYYFTNPYSPYSAVIDPPNVWRGADIYPVGDDVFSYRFTHFINTFWLVNIAPFALAGDFDFRQDKPDNGDEDDDQVIGPPPQLYRTPTVKTTGGYFTPELLVMQVNKGWCATLVISSLVMLFSALSAAALGLMRRGPNVLDRASNLMRYKHQSEAASLASTENFEAGAPVKLNQVRVCLGDVSPSSETGYIALGPVGGAVPLGRQGRSRTYK